MRLLTFLSVALVISASGVFPPQPCAAVQKPNKKHCSRCPAAICSSAKSISRKNSGNQQMVFYGGRVPVPALPDSEVITWNFKARGLLN